MQKLSKYLVLVLIYLFSCDVAVAAHPPETVGRIPLDVLTAPIPIRENLVRVHHPVSTRDPAAQTYFDQGVTELQLYGWIDAARSFHAALRKDEGIVLAWLGLSQAFLRMQDRDSAMAALSKAEDLAATAALSDRERAWLNLRGRVLRGPAWIGGWEADELSELRADVAAAVAAYPTAPEFLFLQSQIAPSERRIALLEAVLEVAPDHAGAHHQLVHQLELSPDQVHRAVRHGEKLRKIAPTSAHARHMLGHNLGRVGRMDEALAEFVEADAIETRTEIEEGVPVRYNWHHLHNLSFLIRANYHQLRIDEADTALARYLSALGERKVRATSLMDYRYAMDYLIGRGDWTRLRDLAVDIRVERPFGPAVGHYLDAVKLLASERYSDALGAQRLGDLALGEQELPRHLRIYRKIPAAVLASRDRELEKLDALIEQVAVNENPHSWSRAHGLLDGILRLLEVSENEEAMGLVMDAFERHDPAYPGLLRWKDHQLLNHRREASSACEWLRATFGAEVICHQKERVAVEKYYEVGETFDNPVRHLF